MRFSFKKKMAAAAAVVVLVGSGTAAFAFWSAGGTGSGSASTSPGSSGITINQTSPAITDLAPGVAAEPLSGNFDNSNASAVHVNQVTASIAVTPVGANLCSAADYDLVQPTATNALVPTGLAQGSWTGGSLGFHNTLANQDGCKGATVNISYTSN
jgi:hypothetical protein